MQLAYSYDGRHWQRALRETFLGGKTALQKVGYENHLVWLTDVREREDGDINIYASVSQLEHGPAFEEPGTGRIHIYRLRKDGFICLETENRGEESVVTTREKVWHGGELHVNIKAKKATLAVWESAATEDVGFNFLGISQKIEGYRHEDCEVFEGDSTDWIPRFKNGKTLQELSGRTLVFEIKFLDGQLYSLEGDFTNVSNTQAARYRIFKELPESNL